MELAIRSRTSPLALLVSLAALFVPGSSEAAPPAAHGMRPAAGSESHLTAESSQVLPAWTPTATLLTVYGADRGVAQNAGLWQVERRASSHLLAAIGLFDHAEIGFDLPLVMYQTGSAGQPRATLEPAAIGDLRTTIKGTIFRSPLRGFGLGAALDFTVPTGSVEALAGAGGATVMPQLLAEYRATRGIQAAVNFGYLARPDSNVEDYTIGDALTYRVAGKFPFGPDAQFEALAELDGAIGVVDGADHPLTLRAGVRWRMRSGILLGLYGGGAPISTLGTPDGHAMLSLGYAPPNLLGAERAFAGAARPDPVMLARRHERAAAIHRQAAGASEEPAAPVDPNDLDLDGVMLVADDCPTVAEDRDGFEDGDGCPEWDNDRDGVRDGLDMCPSAPEVNNGYADWDGCPDLKRDGGGESFERFDFERHVPVIEFAGESEALNDAARQSLARFAEVLRLNPWMSQIDLRVYAARPDAKAIATTATPQVPEALRARASAIAQARALSIHSYLTSLGIDAWRVRIESVRPQPVSESRQVVLALRGQNAGLAPLAPTPARVQELLADAASRALEDRRPKVSSPALPDSTRPPTKIEVLGQGGEAADENESQRRSNSPAKVRKRSKGAKKSKRKPRKPRKPTTGNDRDE